MKELPPKKLIFNEIKAKYKKIPEAFRKAGEKTHGKGRHKPHKVGEHISFKIPRGRGSGKVVEAHREFYIVDTGRQILKINRNSILYSMGAFAGKAVQTYYNLKGSYEHGKDVEKQNLEKFKKKGTSKPRGKK